MAEPGAPTSAAEWVIRESPGPLATYAIEHLGHRAQPTIAYTLIGLPADGSTID